MTLRALKQLPRPAPPGPAEHYNLARLLLALRRDGLFRNETIVWFWVCSWLSECGSRLGLGGVLAFRG